MRPWRGSSWRAAGACERLELGVERGGGGSEAVEPAHEQHGVGSGDVDECAYVGAADVDVIEAHEYRGHAPAAEARGHDRDAVERVELLAERKHEEARVVGGHERVHGMGAEAERAEALTGMSARTAWEPRQSAHGVV